MEFLESYHQAVSASFHMGKKVNNDLVVCTINGLAEQEQVEAQQPAELIPQDEEDDLDDEVETEEAEEGPTLWHGARQATGAEKPEH